MSILVRLNVFTGYCLLCFAQVTHPRPKLGAMILSLDRKKLKICPNIIGIYRQNKNTEE